MMILQIAAPITRFAEPATFQTGNGQWHDEFYCVLTLLWLLGIGVCFALWWRKRHRFCRMMKQGVSVEGGREVDVLRRAQVRLGMKRKVSLILLQETTDMGVWGAWRPVLLLPGIVTNQLSEEDLEAVMLHELMHIKRWDNFVSTLHMTLCCLLWFHPLVWIVDRRLLIERESACDEGVIGLGIPREIFAASILKVYRSSISGETAGVSRASGDSLKRRLESIMKSFHRKSLSHKVATHSITTLLVMFTIFGGTFSRASVLAESSLYKHLIRFPYVMPPVKGQDPKVRNRFRRIRIEPNLLAPELYAENISVQFMLVNLPGTKEAESYWEGSYQLFFVSEEAQKKLFDKKIHELAPKGGTVGFNIEPSEYTEKILLKEGKFKKSGLATLQDRIYRSDDIDFKARIPEALRTKGAWLITVYTVRVFDGRLKIPVYHSGVWMTHPFDDDAGDEQKVRPRTIVYSNFFISPKGEIFSSQWARNTTDTDW